MVDLKIENELKELYKEKGRGILNIVRNERYPYRQYLWNRFPLLQDKRYSNGMRLYWLFNEIEDFPQCQCKENGIHQNKTSRCNLNGYKTAFCSRECAVHESIKVSMDTKLKKYGNRGYNNAEKAKKTLQENYGITNAFQRKDVIQRILKKRKLKMTSIMKKAWETRDKEVKEEYRAYRGEDRKFLLFLELVGITCLECRAYSKEERKMVRLKAKQYAKMQTNKIRPVFTINDWIRCEDPWKLQLEWKCDKGHIFKDHFRTHYANHLRCPICNPYLDVGTSDIEREMQRFIESLVPHQDSDRNTRQVIKPLELDDYVREKNIAFEMNGLYSHCSLNKKPKYHQLKTSACEKLGIQLVHIFEDEWNFKKEICKSYIRNALGLGAEVDVHDLHVVDIDEDIADEFFRENFLFKSNKERFCDIGLVDNEKQLLFACRFVRRSRNRYEISCFSSKIGSNVKFGIDSIMKCFIKKFNPSYLSLKLDRRYFNIRTLQDGKMFLYHHYLKKDYCYVNYGFSRRYSRSEITEDFMKNLKLYDENLSVELNMKNNKFEKIYDVGYDVLTWKNNNQRCCQQHLQLFNR